MRVNHLVVATVLLTLAGCPDAPANDDGETSGDGDGDPTGDGDGDGETSGDGDGDGDDECSCENNGSFEQCEVGEMPVSVHSTLSWPVDSELELDEICTVTANSVDALVELDCPAGLVTITLELTPAWAPGFSAGEQLHLRASESLGMSEGDDWQYVRWRLDRADDSQLLASYLNSQKLNFIADPFATEIVSDLCPRTCEQEFVRESVGLRMTSGAVELLLFGGQTGDLGEHLVWVSGAERHICTDSGPGRYVAAIVAKP